MFKRLRLELTAQFIALSALVYLILATLATALVYLDLSKDLDAQLVELAETAANVVQVEEESLKLAEHPYICEDNTHVKSSVQFFDREQKHIRTYGEPGTKKLYMMPAETIYDGNAVRIISRPLVVEGRQMGYVQVQLSTSSRDQAVRQFVAAALYTVPVLLLALGGCGYYFAGVVLRPVESTFDLQKRFLADAGHELKTPVAVIGASLDNLEELDTSQPVSKRIERIRRSTLRMEKLVSELLLLTKSEQEIGSLKKEKFELDMLLREVMGEIEDLFEDKKEIQLSGNLEPVTVDANRAGLYTAFTNLIKNAMIYTESGGSVTVSVKKMGRGAQVRIKDTGIGIAAESIPRLFDRFYREDASRRQIDTQDHLPGSGLGLAIVKAIIDRHAGEIVVDSEPGKGTVFIVTLP